jgi:hypothetical protein
MPAQALAEVPTGRKRADWGKNTEAADGLMPQKHLRRGAARSWCMHSRLPTLRSSIRELGPCFMIPPFSTALSWGQPLHLNTPS